MEEGLLNVNLALEPSRLAKYNVKSGEKQWDSLSDISVLFCSSSEQSAYFMNIMKL